MDNEISWQYMSAEEALSAFSTDAARGLKSAAVSHRRAKFGENDLWEIKKTPFRSIIVKYLLDGVSAFLLVDLLCAAFAGFDWQFVLILLISVAFIAMRVACDAVLSHLAARGAESAVPETLVLRDGKTSLVPAVDLVPGDVVILSEGDLVPADIRVISCDSLVVSEKGVTENDIPVEKTPDALLRRPSSGEPENMSNMLFALSYVLRGSCRGVCAATGERTLAAAKGKKHVIKADAVGSERKKAERFAALSSSALMVAAMLYIFVGLFAFKGKFTVTAVFLGALSFAVAGFGTIRASLILFAHFRRTVRLFRAGAFLRDPDAPSFAEKSAAFLVRDVSELAENNVEIHKAVAYGKSFEGDALSSNDPDLREIFKMISLSTPSFAAATAPSQGKIRSIGQRYKSTVSAYLERTNSSLSDLTSNSTLAALIPKGEESIFDTAIWFEGGTYHAACFGEIDRVLSVCRTVILDGFEETLSREKIARYIALAKELENKGCRVIAVAYRVPPTENFSRLSVIQNQMGFVGFVAVRAVPCAQTAQIVRAFSSSERTMVCFVSSRSDAVFAAEDKMLAGASRVEVVNSAEVNALKFEKGRNYIVCIPDGIMTVDERTKLMLIAARRLKKEIGEFVFAGRALADGVFAREANVRVCAVYDKRLRPAPYSLAASADVMCNTTTDAAACDAICELVRSSDRQKRFDILGKYLIASQIGRAILLFASLFLPPVIPAVVYLIWGFVLDMSVGGYILLSKRVGASLLKPRKTHGRV